MKFKSPVNAFVGIKVDPVADGAQVGYTEERVNRPNRKSYDRHTICDSVMERLVVPRPQASAALGGRNRPERTGPT